ncbi:MAG: cytochrome d ubiquinol oxidase subunit II [Woeseiaceae bacterium]
MANFLGCNTDDGQWLVVLFTLLLPFATYIARPMIIHNDQMYPAWLLLPRLTIIALILAFIYRRKNNDFGAFVTSSALILILMLNVGFTIYPNLLVATTDPANSLTIYNTATSEYAMRLGLIWFSVGITLAIAYTLFMYRSFRGKVRVTAEEEGY